MRQIAECNRDYLAARLHGRRSRMSEGERLDYLSRVNTIPDFAEAIFSDTMVKTAADAQRRLIRELIQEMDSLCRQLKGAQARLLTWMLTQFQIANLKIIIRGILSHKPPEVLANHLIALPANLNDAALIYAKSLEECIQLLPEEPLGKMVRETLGSLLQNGSISATRRPARPLALHNSKEMIVLNHGGPPAWPEQRRMAPAAEDVYKEHLEPFFIEAMLDQKYFQEELVRVNKLTHGEGDKVMRLVVQEIDIFHFMLVMRGRFQHGLDPAHLAPLHVEGTRLSRHLFETMLTTPDRFMAAKLAVGRVVDSLPASMTGPDDAFAVPVVSGLETLAWKRYLKLANRIFRQSLTDFGIFAGYVGLRRMEIANLITLSEGIRARISGEVIRQRMITPLHSEALHV